jgi:hypothetical protein
MRNVGHQTLGLSSPNRDDHGKEIRAKTPKYSLEAIIALQSALQHGIPDSEEEQPELEDEVVSLNGKTAHKDSAAQQGGLTLMLTEIRRFVSAAIRPLRRSRLQKSTAGQR